MNAPSFNRFKALCLFLMLVGSMAANGQTSLTNATSKVAVALVSDTVLSMATIGGYQSGAAVPLEVMKVQAGVGVYVKNAPIKLQYSVRRFTLKTEIHGSVKSVTCTAAAFSKEAKSYLQALQPGAVVTIENIMVRDGSGKDARLSSLVYYIK